MNTDVPATKTQDILPAAIGSMFNNPAAMVELAENAKPKKFLVIYHLNCFDGFIAACVTKLALVGLNNDRDDIVYMPMEYGLLPSTEELAEAVANREVYIVDFSLPVDVTEIILAYAKKVVMIDHHASAVKKWINHPLGSYEIAGTLELVMDSDASGAMLTHLYFLQHSKLYASTDNWRILYGWVTAANDYDLWKFVHSETRAIAEFFYSKPYAYDNNIDGFFKDNWAFRKLYSDEVEEGEERKVSEVVKNGNVIIEYKKGTIERLYAGYGGWMVIDGFRVPVMDVGRGWQSMAADVMSEAHPGALFNVSTFTDHKLGVKYFSLRTTRGMKFDVSEIAEKFGGAGHATAAGFKVWLFPKEPSLSPVVEAIPPRLTFVKSFIDTVRYYCRKITMIG